MADQGGRKRRFGYPAIARIRSVQGLRRLRRGCIVGITPSKRSNDFSRIETDDGQRPGTCQREHILRVITDRCVFSGFGSMGDPNNVGHRSSGESRGFEVGFVIGTDSSISTGQDSYSVSCRKGSHTASRHDKVERRDGRARGT